MGKPTGFIEFNREIPLNRSPLQRTKDWKEFHDHLPSRKLEEQGGRCMDCGVPFCHSGDLLNGATAGCPVHNLIPEWNDLIYRGLWKEALERLHKTNNFPEFTGRICPAPCEESCVLGIIEPPVTIKNNECAIVDKGWDEGWIQATPPETRTGKKVAVVGSGPAGLASAAQLNQAGHTVTVYERADRIGGLLMYGIPNMKLEKDMVQRRVDVLAEEGITFITSTAIGIDIPATQIRENFDAIILCCGATKPRELPISGRELDGIHQAIPFLHLNTKSLLDSGHKDGKYISAKDKHVIVIGGGDTGTDCVGTALRHGCKTLNQFEIMPRPPDQRNTDNPWPEWGKIFRVDYGQAEAKAHFGSDPRSYLIMTEQFVGDENGNVKELHTVDIDWDYRDGVLRPLRKAGTERVWDADIVLLSMGFVGPEDTIVKQLKLDCDDLSNVQAEHGKYTTNIEGVFAAGDMRRGQSLVVWAINEGREAARECDRYLMGTSNLP